MRSGDDVRDVLVIGSGAGGGPLALRLSRAGFDVLVLEKGPRHARADYRHDELLHADRPGFFVPPTSSEPHVLVRYRGGGEPAAPERSWLGWLACCVGGGTAHMGASLYRFHPDDFRLRSRLGAFEEVEDWPYGYDALERYYVRAEWTVGVSGAGATHPYEGRRSRSLPLPPLPSHPLAAHVDAACERLGLTAFATPRGINSRPYAGRPACELCDFCAGYGCPAGARGSTQEALLPRAEATGRCEVRAGATVHRVTVDARGRADGCLYLDPAGAEHRVRARVVCVCASAVETARLLLLSACPSFPDGLANGSGRVGRHLQFHATSDGRARFRYDRHPGKGLSDRTPFLGRSVMDHYFLPAGAAAYAKGGLLRFDMQRTYPIEAAERIAFEGPTGPLWGARLKERLRAYFRDAREVEFEVFHDFFPNARTRVELDPDVCDHRGIPVARIYLEEPAHHRAAGAWLRARGLEVLEAAGADELIPGEAGRTATVMVHGTCRAGRDPAGSVLNEFCRAHEIPNLFVVDGSFMPTSGGAPSTLTILANSFRTADYIADRARAGELARAAGRGATHGWRAPAAGTRSGKDASMDERRAVRAAAGEGAGTREDA
jgi:choline dehydrogenase-like flavoprotein